VALRNDNDRPRRLQSRLCFPKPPESHSATTTPRRHVCRKLHRLLQARHSFLHKNSVRLAVNAGASDTEILAKYVKQMCEDAGCLMDIAWVEGDEVTEQVMKMKWQGEKFESLMDGRKIEEWGLEPVCAQAYLGGLGIARVFEKGRTNCYLWASGGCCSNYWGCRVRF